MIDVDGSIILQFAAIASCSSRLADVLPAMDLIEQRERRIFLARIPNPHHNGAAFQSMSTF